MKWRSSRSGPGVPFLDRRGHYVSNDVNKVGREHWRDVPATKQSGALEARKLL